MLQITGVAGDRVGGCVCLLLSLCPNQTRFDGVCVQDVQIIDANLCGVWLCFSNLSGASLTSADLRGADLEKANLQGANLSGADLNEAKLSGAIMPDCSVHD